MIYRERLWAPAGYWVIALVFGLSFVTAVGFYLGPLVALAATVAAAALIAASLLWFGSTEVTVTAAGVRAGRALLEWPYVGGVRELDAEATRLRLGVDADTRAFLVTRPFVKEAVEITVADPADPHHYWLVSTRRPARLAAAIGRRPVPVSEAKTAAEAEVESAG